MSDRAVEGLRATGWGGELAGAFGDLGTFIPFVLAYISIAKMDPAAVLLGFAGALIATGLFYRVPMPVQPMKAIAATATAQAGIAVLAPSAIQVAALVTGVAWTALAVTGLAKRVAQWMPRAVTLGLILGLGMALMLQGIKSMSTAWAVALPLLVAAFLLLSSRRVPVMFLLLAAGIGYAFWHDSQLIEVFGGMRAEFRLPQPAFGDISLHSAAIGVLILALPQMPLTLGNAFVATVEQSNRLFPARPLTERQVAASTGLINLWAAAVGGVPMCHGAGGLAGQVRFGARSGLAPALFGVLLLVVALFFSDSAEILLRLLPASVLGVILFLAGAQLALGICDMGPEKNERFVAVVTAAFALWNVGLAFLLGLLLHQGLRRGAVKL
ncbi:MAG TPA: putative sulfate/molybdate transporter [Burkholderiales bacterium]|nr:putative sulfate/molybdate transporter [Burkholderiales bacterium]